MAWQTYFDIDYFPPLNYIVLINSALVSWHVVVTMYPREDGGSRRPDLPRPSSLVRHELRRAELGRIAAPVALRPSRAAPIEGAAPRPSAAPN